MCEEVLTFLGCIVYYLSLRSEEEHDELRAHVWTCHMSSLHAARPLYQALLEPLPLDEQRFCEGWTCFVDLLAAARHAKWATFCDVIFCRTVGLLINSHMHRT